MPGTPTTRNNNENRHLDSTCTGASSGPAVMVPSCEAQKAFESFSDFVLNPGSRRTAERPLNLTLCVCMRMRLTSPPLELTVSRATRRARRPASLHISTSLQTLLSKLCSESRRIYDKMEIIKFGIYMMITAVDEFRCPSNPRPTAITM